MGKKHRTDLPNPKPKRETSPLAGPKKEHLQNLSAHKSPPYKVTESTWHNGGVGSDEFPFWISASWQHLPKPAGFYPQNKKVSNIPDVFVSGIPNLHPIAKSPPLPKTKKARSLKKGQSWKSTIDGNTGTSAWPKFFISNKQTLSAGDCKACSTAEAGEVTLTGEGSAPVIVEPWGFSSGYNPPENQRLRTENGTLSWRWTQFGNQQFPVPYEVESILFH